MHILIIIIVIIVILSLIGAFFEWVADGGWKLLAGIGFLVVVYLAASWKGILVVIGLGFGGFVVIKSISAMGQYIGEQFRLHDEKVNERVTIVRLTQMEKQAHENENALRNELERNCYWLGCMNEEKWKKKLPNYVNKEYSSSFKEITMNFAKQIEEQRIVNNSEWFEPYVLCILKHDCITVTKLLNEVNCPQLKLTHVTPDEKLITEMLISKTKKISKDVPPWFQRSSVPGIEEDFFSATNYLKLLYSNSNELERSDTANSEMSFDELMETKA